MRPNTRCLFTPRQKALSKVYIVILILMAFTGFGQMPIFKRYYLSDIPGLEWSADFYLTHLIHYMGAIVLLALFSYVGMNYLLAYREKCKLTTSAYIRVALLGALMLTGIFRVIKNLPDVTLSPDFVLLIDLSHLAFTMMLGLAALAFLILKMPWLEKA